MDTGDTGLETNRRAHPQPRHRFLGACAIGLTTVCFAACGGDDPDEAITSSTLDGGVVSTVATDSATATTSASSVPGDPAVGSGTDDGPSVATTIHEVPENTVEVLPPIELDGTGDFGTGVTVEVLGLEAVDGEARLPGEVAGPALRVEVRLTNDTGEVLDLAGARIDITYGPDRTPGISLGQPDVVRFPLSLEPGEQAVAASVFGVPLAERDQVQVAVWYTVDAPIVVFEGAAPTE